MEKIYSLSRLIICPSSAGILPLKLLDERFLHQQDYKVTKMFTEMQCSVVHFREVLTGKSSSQDCGTPMVWIHSRGSHEHC